MQNPKQNLSKSAQSIQNILTELGVTFTVIELPDSTRTANEAAATIGCDIAQIIKSLIFCTTHSKKPLLVLASGINRVNEKNIEKEIMEKIMKAEADYIKELTGFAIGGIPPLGHKQKIDTYIDETLLNYDELWAAAGTPHSVFSLPPAELIRLTHGKVIAIK